MKSIWLPLALLAGSVGSAAAQHHDHNNDDAIQQAKLELEQAQQHLKQLLAEQADKQALLEQKLADAAAKKAEITWLTATAPTAPAPAHEGQAKVITKTFTIGDAPAAPGDCEGPSESAQPQTFAISIDGDLELGDAFAQAFTGGSGGGGSISLGGGDSDVQVIDLGDGRTVMIQVEAGGLDLNEGMHSFGFAPEMGDGGGIAWITDVESEGSDCCGSCEEQAPDPHATPLGHGGMMGGQHGMMGGGHGGMMGGQHGMMGGGHGGMMGGQHGMMGGGHGGMKGGQGGPQAFNVFHGQNGQAFGFHQGRGHEVMIRVDGGAPQRLQIPCESQGGQARAPRAPQAFWGQGLRQSHPMFLEMRELHGEHGDMWSVDMDEHHGDGADMWFVDMTEHEGDDLWSSGYVKVENLGSTCDSDCESCCDAGASEGQGTIEWAEAIEVRAPAVGLFLEAEAGCEADCSEACCEAAAPVAVDAFFVGSDDVDAEIEALIAELESVSFDGEAHSGHIEVIEVEGYDEIDALIAEIEAELSGLGDIGYVVEEPILIDTEIMDHDEVDEKQERIEELEAEVDELRELVESLVKELNQR